MSTGNVNLDPAKATNSAERTILVANEKMKRGQPLSEAEAAFVLHFASNNDKLSAQLKHYIATHPPTGAAAASSGATAPSTSGAPTAQGDGIEWALTDPLRSWTTNNRATKAGGQFRTAKQQLLATTEHCRTHPRRLIRVSPCFWSSDMLVRQPA